MKKMKISTNLKVISNKETLEKLFYVFFYFERDILSKNGPSTCQLIWLLQEV